MELFMVDRSERGLFDGGVGRSSWYTCWFCCRLELDGRSIFTSHWPLVSGLNSRHWWHKRGLGRLPDDVRIFHKADKYNCQL